MKIEREIGILLREKGQTLAAAESCTGGLIAHRITNIPGSSDYFERGYVVYSNKAKTELLGVDPRLIRRHGAVSPEVARAMAEGARRAAGTDYSVGVTGIAGPTRDRSAKPVGLVFIAVCGPRGKARVEKCNFKGTRLQIKNESADRAFEMLRKFVKRERMSS
ncbi:MAG: CinA family protein [Candidatus Abyssobacteria bacterium SURF_5]|uniref:CinA family protein n=1 Tax=Abyssobacteria bacterium (strain SURF_5) TaxID=2093360 RepID=A0A3A4NQS2_ABYX5|nr:MAG: CinA family protein [Candidatus Abyssubacteria bacterium SURF_5]